VVLADLVDVSGETAGVDGLAASSAASACRMTDATVWSWKNGIQPFSMFQMPRVPIRRRWGRTHDGVAGGLAAAGIGLAYGVLWWVLGALLIMPTWLGMNEMIFEVNTQRMA